MIAHATRSERAGLARLALDYAAALLAFQAACELADYEPCARTESRCRDTREALARAATAIASWCEGGGCATCGLSHPPRSCEPQSHGARRGVTGSSLAAQADALHASLTPREREVLRERFAGAGKDDRRLALELADANRCKTCGGSGLRSPFDLDPCHGCAGTGAA